MVCNGDSAVIGSWKMMEMTPPRMDRICLPAMSSRAMSMTASGLRGSRSSMAPCSIRATLGRMPMIACATMDLPEPDSPTSAIVRPAGMRNDTPSTAFTRPASTSRYTLRSLTVNTLDMSS